MIGVILIIAIAAIISIMICIITAACDIIYSEIYSEKHGVRKYFVTDRTTKTEVNSNIDIIKHKLVLSVAVFFILAIVTIIVYFKE